MEIVLLAIAALLFSGSVYAVSKVMDDDVRGEAGAVSLMLSVGDTFALWAIVALLTAILFRLAS